MFAAATALAVPLGVAFGTRSGTTGGSASERSPRETLDLSASSVPIKWDQAPDTLAVPEIPQDRASSDYSPGKYDQSNFAPGQTEIGARDVRATFVYAPLTGTNKLPLHVTYGLDVVKADAPPVALPTWNFEHEYGADVAAFSVDDYLAGSEYEAYHSPEDPTPVLTDARGAHLTLDAVPILSVGTKFTAVYKALLDLVHYNDNGTPEPVWTINYTVAGRELEDVDPQFESRHQRFGAPFSLPEAKAPEANYDLKETAPLTRVTYRPSDAVSTPAEGQAIVPTNVSAYEQGTEFTITYTYAPTANYAGRDYTFTYVFTIGTDAAVPPAEGDKVLPASRFAYGQYGAANAPAAPSQWTDFTGTYASASITKRSPVTGAGSPTVGTVADWRDINTYNAGTEVEAVFTYAPAPGYTGRTFTAKKTYVVDKQKVLVPEDADPTAGRIRYGADPATLAAPNRNHEAFRPATARYFAGEGSSREELTAAQAGLQPAGDVLTVVWTFALDEGNYAPLSGTKTSYTASTAYTVDPNAVSYAGKATYDPVTRVYKDGLADTTPTSLPDAEAGQGYVFKSATYRVTRKSNDGLTPVGALADLSKSTAFGAGTIVTATYVFAPSADHAGPDVIATGTIEVVKRAAVPPTATELAGPNTDKAYGEVQVRPTTARTFEGYKAGTYRSAKVKVRGTGSPAVNANAAWNSFKDYGPGTVVTVTHRFEPDTNNYTGVTVPADYTETITVVKRTVVLPTASELLTLGTLEYVHGTNVAKPSAPSLPGRGFIGGTLSSAVVTRQSQITTEGSSPAVGTVVNWASFKTYNSDTEVTVTFTYNLDSTTYASDSASYVLTQKYVVVRKWATRPPSASYAVGSYRHGTVFQMPSPAPRGGEGFGNARIWKANTFPEVPFDWTRTEQYPVGTRIYLHYEYPLLPNYDEKNINHFRYPRSYQEFLVV